MNTVDDPAHYLRRAVRYPPRPGSRVECCQDRSGLGPDLTVDTLNLSETGIRLLLHAALAPGEEVRLQLSGEALPQPLVRFGRVVWLLELPASDYYFVGLSFDRPLPTEQLQCLVLEGE